MLTWAEHLKNGLAAGQRDVGEPLLQDLGRRLGVLDRLGLGHLALSRNAATLSGGELQRTRLAAQLSTELSGIVFVLDEPGTGLHPADKTHLLEIALELTDAGEHGAPGRARPRADRPRRLGRRHGPRGGPPRRGCPGGRAARPRGRPSGLPHRTLSGRMGHRASHGSAARSRTASAGLSCTMWTPTT